MEVKEQDPWPSLLLRPDYTLGIHLSRGCLGKVTMPRASNAIQEPITSIQINTGAVALSDNPFFIMVQSTLTIDGISFTTSSIQVVVAL